MYSYVKRAGDFLIALLAIIVLSPLFLVIGLLIKLESPGPVFFIQKRFGQSGKYFNIYKFRSMKIETPNLATDKLSNPEQYITQVGKFIRKTSLDELPQIFNILFGDMSMVGPRPALYNQYELIEKRCLLGIDQLKPGLTGYAQIMGRDFIKDDQKVNYDKYYMDNISFFFDLKIMFLTVSHVLTAKDVKLEEGSLNNQITQGKTQDM